MGIQNTNNLSYFPFERLPLDLKQEIICHLTLESALRWSTVSNENHQITTNLRDRITGFDQLPDKLKERLGVFLDEFFTKGSIQYEKESNLASVSIQNTVSLSRPKNLDSSVKLKIETGTKFTGIYPIVYSPQVEMSAVLQNKEFISCKVWSKLMEPMGTLDTLREARDRSMQEPEFNPNSYLEEEMLKVLSLDFTELFS